MMITDHDTIAKISYDAGEMQDGLFTFASQGAYIIDSCRCSVWDGDDNITEYYLVEIYAYKEDEVKQDFAELHNYGVLTADWFAERKIDRIHEKYDGVSWVAFDDRAEALQYHFDKMVELNKDCF